MDRLFTPWRYAYITSKDETPHKKGVPEALAAWPGDFHCVFCNMLAAVDYAIKYGMDRAEAEEAIGLLERGKTCFLVLNAFPYSTGHMMAVPYKHESSLAALPGETAAELMVLMRRAERVLRRVYQPEGLNMGLNLGESAGAGVAHHLHIHALPRWSGDTNFMTVVAETRILPEMLSDSWKRLRQAFAEEVPGVEFAIQISRLMRATPTKVRPSYSYRAISQFRLARTLRIVSMRLSSIEQLKSTVSPQSRFAPVRETSHRTGHGGTAWASASTSIGEVKLYQPQDGATDSRSRVADIASRLRKMAGEPEDARLTGGTRSLMRRLSGLNVGMEMVRRAKPVVQSVIPNRQLPNANVA